MSERFSDDSDEVLGRRLASELPRYTAPARLRAEIAETAVPQPARPVWVTAALSVPLLAIAMGGHAVAILSPPANTRATMRMNRALPTSGDADVASARCICR